MSAGQTRTGPKQTTPKYSVSACLPGDLSEEELATCLTIIRDGGAVAISLKKLQNTGMVAVARKDGVIVGVGSIKRGRPDRAVEIAQESGFDFPRQTLELGYIAVSPQHRRQGISHQLVRALVKAMPGGFFATTDDDHMKKTLSVAGFTRHGGEWPGRRGQLSLWLKQGTKP